MCVRFFTEFLGGIEDVTLVSSDDLRRFIVSLRGKTPWNKENSQNKRISPTTINTYVRALRSFWSWLARGQVITTNPFTNVPAPRFPKRIARTYSEEQLKTVLQVVVQKPRDRAIFELFLDSGIRLSELTSLKVEDVDLVMSTVRVMGKGGKERRSYFSAATACTLNDYIEQRPTARSCQNILFLTADGKPLTNQGVQSLMQRIGKAASLPVRLTPHNLRHTYATLCLKNGSNLEYIRITLGHTDVKTTSDAYLAATQSDVAQAYKKFSPLFNMGKKRK